MMRQHIIAALLLVAPLLAACGGDPIVRLTPAAPIPAPTAVVAQPVPNPTDALQPHPTPIAGPPVATLPPAPGAAPAVAPITSGFLIYPESDGSLWRAARPGLPPQQLVPPSTNGTAPNWAASPDGALIAVITSAGVYPAQQRSGAAAAALWLMNADGSGAHKLLDLLPPTAPTPQPSGLRDPIPPTIAAQIPAWSPDGTLLAFVSAHAETIDLYTAARNGALARLTNTPQVEQAPIWSPDGALIAYQTTSTLAPGAIFGLAVSRRAGGAPVFARAPLPLSNGDGAAEITGRTWTDSRTLALGLTRGSLCGGEVQLIDLVAGTATSILRRAEGCVGPPMWGVGARMLAISVGGGTAEPVGLYRWAPGDPEAKRIAPGPPMEIAWNPTGDVLTYRLPSARGDHSNVVLWRAGAEPITVENVDWPPHWSADGRMLALGATIVDADGRRVATLPEPWASPLGWGAHGLYYAVVRANPVGQTELWLWDGRAAQLLHTLPNDDALFHTGVVTSQAPSPIAGQRAYVLLAGGVVRAWDTTSQTIAEVTPIRPDADPATIALAPDGGALAYVTGGQIYVHELTSGAEHDITPAEFARGIPTNAGPLNGIRWSPDGRALLFDLDSTGDSLTDPRPVIYLAGRDGAAVRALGPGLGPAWSPSGQQIAYAGPPFTGVGLHGGGPGGVLTVTNADGSGARPFGAEPFFPGWQPAVWSAGGRRIAAGDLVYDAGTGAVATRAPRSAGQEVAAVLYLGADGGLGIWRNVRTPLPDDAGEFTARDEFVVIGPDGAEQPIARSAELRCPCLALARQVEAAWSPRGDVVALAGQFVGASAPELRFYEANGALRRAVPLLTQGWITSAPIWSPDGAAVLLTLHPVGSDNGEVWIFPLGGAPRQIGTGRGLGWR